MALPINIKTLLKGKVVEWERLDFKNGSPDPIFETDENNQYFLATLPIHPAFLNGESREKDPESKENGEKHVDNDEKHVDNDEKYVDKDEKHVDNGEKHVDKTRNRILSLLREKPNITLKEIQSILNLSRRGLEDLVFRLKQEGLLEREGAKRKGRWIVKT